MNVEIHAMRFEDDDAKRATEPTYCTKPAQVVIEPDQEVVIRAKNGIVHLTIDGQEQGRGFNLDKWDYTAVAITYTEGKDD